MYVFAYILYIYRYMCRVSYTKRVHAMHMTKLCLSCDYAKAPLSSGCATMRTPHCTKLQATHPRTLSTAALNICRAKAHTAWAMSTEPSNLAGGRSVARTFTCLYD